MALKKIVLDLETHPAFAPDFAKASSGKKASADCLLSLLNGFLGLGGTVC